LERAWEETLQAQQTLEEDYHRFLQQQPRVLTNAERDAIRQLAADIPALPTFRRYGTRPRPALRTAKTSSARSWSG
jgi:hypothetical protein